jgi:hypothetical protein
MPVLAFRPSTPSLLSICGGCPGSAILPSAMMSPSGAASSAHGRYGESTRPRCSPRYQRFESAFLQRRVTSEPIDIALNSGTDAFISK